LKHPISVYLIAGNEEEYIARCLQSFKPISAELILCIARGNAIPDKTEEIARGLGAKIVNYTNKNDWPHIDDFATARNTALEACSSEWCLWVDADDVMAEDGAKIVEEAIDLAIRKRRSPSGVKVQCGTKRWFHPTPRGNAPKKGTCYWKNRVHEMLVTKEPNKTIGVDKIFRIHKPAGYKPKSAERNFRILADTLSTAPNALILPSPRILFIGAMGQMY
jgi:glycosyltransferase involved in cell wall biosynthesis